MSNKRNIKDREKLDKLNKIGWIGTIILFGVFGIVMLIIYIVDGDNSNADVLGTYHAYSSSIGMKYKIVLKDNNECTYTTLSTKFSNSVPATNECTYTVNGLNLKLVLVNKVVTEYDEPYTELDYTFDDSFVSFKQDSGLTYLKDLKEID